MIEVQTKIYNKVLKYGRLAAVPIMANKTIFLEERFLLAVILFPS
jgi:hypothetical protein